MSIESENGDQKAARELLEGSATLKNDDYAKRVLNNGGVADNGSRVDIGNFLAGREAYLENDEQQMAAVKERDPEAVKAAMLVHSIKPEIERAA